MNNNEVRTELTKDLLHFGKENFSMILNKLKEVQKCD